MARADEVSNDNVKIGCPEQGVSVGGCNLRKLVAKYDAKKHIRIPSGPCLYNSTCIKLKSHAGFISSTV